MPSATQKDLPILTMLFGDENIVKKYNCLEDPGTKIGMIWSTHFFQRFLKENSDLRCTKSEGDSKRFRDAGNKHYLVFHQCISIDLNFP